MLMVQDVSSQFPAPTSMAAMPPHCYGLYPGSQAKLNSFSHKLLSVMVFYHNNKKIINIVHLHM